MPTIHTKYLGNLRTEATHLASGVRIITDAPIDNNGKGEAFSPTDLASASLVSCMMTLMGILAEREGIDLTGLEADCTKIMAANPRKIAEIVIDLRCPDLDATEIQREKLKRAALTCPVALSLGADVEQTVRFHF
jgi:putative redox protein